MGSADDRRFAVLRAIVADFVATKEPIGSKSLVERHNLGVSSATVRSAFSPPTHNPRSHSGLAP